MAARQDRRRKGATSCFFARPFPDTYDRSQVLFGRSQPPRTEGDGNEGERESHLREPQVTRRVWRPPPWPAARPCLATAHREDGGREREPEHGHARCRRRALGGRPMTQKRGFASFGKKRTEDARTKGGGNPETPSDALWTTRPKRSFLARPLRCMLGHRFLTSLFRCHAPHVSSAQHAAMHASLLPLASFFRSPSPKHCPISSSGSQLPSSHALLRNSSTSSTFPCLFPCGLTYCPFHRWGGWSEHHAATPSFFLLPEADVPPVEASHVPSELPGDAFQVGAAGGGAVGKAFGGGVRLEVAGTLLPPHVFVGFPRRRRTLGDCWFGFRRCGGRRGAAPPHGGRRRRRRHRVQRDLRRGEEEHRQEQRRGRHHRRLAVADRPPVERIEDAPVVLVLAVAVVDGVFRCIVHDGECRTGGATTTERRRRRIARRTPGLML